MASEPLFEKIKNKQIIAFDLFGKNHKRWLKNFKFRPSVYGVLWEGEKILVQRHPKIQKFGLPGGGVEIDESISQALEREFGEETGVKVKTGKLLGVFENYFTHKGFDIHGILMFYEVKKVGGKILSDGNGLDTAEVKFIEISKLTEKNSSRSHWKFIKEYKPKTGRMDI